MPLDQDFDDTADTKEMSFFDHLDELRKYLLRAIAGVVVFSILALCFPGILFDTIIFGPSKLDFWTYQKMCDLSHWLNNNDSLCIKKMDFIVFSSTVTGQFTQYFIVSIIAGVILAFPWILYQLWQFIKPALSTKEMRYANRLVGYGSLLFFLGILFGYYILTPISLNFLGNFKLVENIQNQFTIQSYISFVAMLTFATGIIFELPIIIFFLSKLGLVTAAFLKKYRRYALVIILFIAAVLTPPDVTSQVLMTIPLALLYEVGIVIAKRVEKLKATEEQNS